MVAELAGQPLGDVAVDPGTHMVYVTDSTYGRLVVVDGISHRIVDTLNVGGVQTGVAVDPETHTVYVSRERVAGNAPGSASICCDGNVHVVGCRGRVCWCHAGRAT